jgi:PAS domain S-box-containing protein
VAENTHNAIIVTSEEGKIVWVDNGFTRITEYQQEEVIGKKPGDFLQGVNSDKNTIKKIFLLASKV